MIQLGLDDQGPAYSKWVPRWWRGRTVRGETIDVRTSKYADPVWQQVYDLHVRDTLVQAMGRARAILPDGMEAMVVTCEPLGLSLSDEAVVTVNSTASRALDVVCEGSTQSSQYYQLIMTSVGVGRRTAFKLLGELQELGVLNKVKRGCYQLHDAWSRHHPPP